MIKKFIPTMVAIVIMFSGNVDSAEQGVGEQEVPCRNFSMAIRESFKRIPRPTLQEIRPLYKDDSSNKIFAPLSSRPSGEDVQAVISVYRCGLERSSAYGKVVGFEYKKPGSPGDYVQFRLDWDDHKGGHVNLQIGEDGRTTDKKKYAFTIKEDGRKSGAPITSEKDFQRLISRLDKSDRNARDIVSILTGLSNIRNPREDIKKMLNPKYFIEGTREQKYIPSLAAQYLKDEIQRQQQNNSSLEPSEQSGQWAEGNEEASAQGQAEAQGT